MASASWWYVLFLDTREWIPGWQSPLNMCDVFPWVTCWVMSWWHGFLKNKSRKWQGKYSKWGSFTRHLSAHATLLCRCCEGQENKSLSVLPSRSLLLGRETKVLNLDVHGKQGVCYIQGHLESIIHMDADSGPLWAEPGGKNRMPWDREVKKDALSCRIRKGKGTKARKLIKCYLQRKDRMQG